MNQEVKSVVVKLDSIKDYSENESRPLGSKDMSVITGTTYMGILRKSTNQEMHNVEASILKAKRTSCGLMGSGLHGENGLDPETAISLLQTYFNIGYSCTILWTGSYITHWKRIGHLGDTIQKLFKKILSVPCTTADPVVYLMSGLLPAEALIYIRMFTTYGNITR